MNAATIQAKINATLTGDTSAKVVRRVRDLLGKLTVKQIHEVKKTYHVKASGRTKADLIAKVAERIVKGQTVQVGDVAAQKACPFQAFGLDRTETERGTLRVSDEMYMTMLLAGINNLTNAKCKVHETWMQLGSHWNTIRKIIRSESFRHDYGTLNEKQVRALVRRLHGIYYIPATRSQAI